MNAAPEPERCPLCGETEHDVIEVGPLRWMVCPKVPADEMWAIDGPGVLKAKMWEGASMSDEAIEEQRSARVAAQDRPMVDPDAGLVPPRALAAVKRVFEAGRAKYADLDDGKAVDTRDKAHHLAKAHGHWNQYLSGDRWDDETGEHALAHTVNRLLLAMERDLRGLP